MSKLLLPLSFLIIVFSLAGCKKCFTCYNECVLCSRTVNNFLILDTLCNDNFNSEAEFQAAIALDTTIGYTCAPMASTYKRDFCVNNPGEKDYPNYFNKGKKARCDEK